MCLTVSAFGGIIGVEKLSKFSQIVAKQKEMLAISDRTDKLNGIIERINNQIDILLDEGAYMQAELDRLWQDYAVLCGEVAE